MIKAIFIDMDDTLIVNEVLYDHARAMMRGYLHHFGIKPDEVSAAIDRIDGTMVPKFGYSRERYPATYEAVLKHFIPNADDEMISAVRGFAESVFETIAPAKPGASDALETLASHFHVYIVTQGDKSVQEKRLSHLPFRDLIDDAFIVEKKDAMTFAAIAKKLGYAPEEVVMIGDSLKSDVIPAVEAGMSAVLIEAKSSNSFHPMHAGKHEMPLERAYKYGSLNEVAHHLALHGTAEKKISLPAPRRPKNSFPKP